MNRTDSSRGKRYFLKTQPILMHMGQSPWRVQGGAPLLHRLERLPPPASKMSSRYGINAEMTL
jgi:hypothetical protein